MLVLLTRVGTHTLRTASVSKFTCGPGPEYGLEANVEPGKALRTVGLAGCRMLR